METKIKPRPRTLEEKLPVDQPGILFSRVQELLLAEDAPSDRELNDKFGFSSSYLRLFKDGKIHNPSVNRMEALYKYLTGRSIRL